MIFVLLGVLVLLIHLYLWKRLVRDTTRPGFLARASAAVAGVAAGGVVGGGMVSALGAPEVNRLSVPLRRLGPGLAGFRIAVVADIHLGPLLGRGHTERIVRMINEMAPD